MTFLTGGARRWRDNGPAAASSSLSRTVGASDGAADDGGMAAVAAGVDGADDGAGHLDMS